MFRVGTKTKRPLFVDSSRFQMQMHTATKDATEGLEGTYTAMRRLHHATFRYFASNLPSRLFRAVECFALSRSSILCSERIAFMYTIVLNKEELSLTLKRNTHIYRIYYIIDTSKNLKYYG